MSSNNDKNVILRAEKITKFYPGTIALDGVSFNVYEGKVNVVVGENGAGKSTLMKILAGVEQPSKGEIIVRGEKVAFQSPVEAEKKGIGIIYQELNLFPNLSIAENIFIARELKQNPFTIDKKKQREEAKKLLERLQHPHDPGTLVESLRIGEQQIVEIAKALAQEASILIMDEPTSALSESEVEILFRIIQELKSHNVSIIYISHRLEELMKIGDYITVLRDGRLIEESKISDIEINWIVRQMVGESTDKLFHGEKHDLGMPLLKVEGLKLPRQGGGYLVDNVNLELRTGEILGIYGLMGAGRTEFFECLMGLRSEATGKVILEDKEVNSRHIGARIKEGFALIPEDRQREGLVQNLSIRKNMTLSSLWKVTKLFHMQKKNEVSTVREYIKKLSIKVASEDNNILSLSGGNQQKVVIGKSLMTEPKVLLMDEPTRGIDVGAKADVFTIINKLAKEGLGIMVVSSELKEILAISDRIIVLSKGKITGEFNSGEFSEEKLVKASAIGHELQKV